MTWKQRYSQAHQSWQSKEYPASYNDFGALATNYPDVRKSNGLTRMILYFLKWEGWRATRINTMGRLVDGPQKQDSGISLITKKFIPSTTRKGTADVGSTILGRSSMFEVKVEGDTPRVNQIKEAKRERRSGGIYEFTYSPDDFFIIYDAIIECVKLSKPIIIPVHRGTIEEQKAIEKFLRNGELTIADL